MQDDPACPDRFSPVHETCLACSVRPASIQSSGSYCARVLLVHLTKTARSLVLEPAPDGAPPRSRARCGQGRVAQTPSPFSSSGIASEERKTRVEEGSSLVDISLEHASEKQRGQAVDALRASAPPPAPALSSSCRCAHLGSGSGARSHRLRGRPAWQQSTSRRARAKTAARREPRSMPT